KNSGVKGTGMKKENWHNHLQETFQDFTPEPEIDLWPGIEAEIRPRRKLFWLPYVVLAAAAAIALLFFLKPAKVEGPAVDQTKIAQTEAHSAEQSGIAEDSAATSSYENELRPSGPSSQDIQVAPNLTALPKRGNLPVVQPPNSPKEATPASPTAPEYSIVSIQPKNTYSLNTYSQGVPMAKPVSRFKKKKEKRSKSSLEPDLDLTKPGAFQFLAFASNKLQPFRRFVPLRVQEQRSSTKEFRLLFIKVKGLEFSRKKYVPNIQKHD
ncbi:MAG: hypothetical protein AAGI38_24080, partial [Bacteroidota bacterium]